MKPQPKYVKRFLGRLLVGDGCWHLKKVRGWGLSTPNVCYAYEADFDDQGGYTHNCSAARLSLALFHRLDFEKIEQTRHLCDDPHCVNPAHLIEGSRSENQIDRTRHPSHMARLRARSVKRLQTYLL